MPTVSGIAIAIPSAHVREDLQVKRRVDTLTSAARPSRRSRRPRANIPTEGLRVRLAGALCVGINPQPPVPLDTRHQVALLSDQDSGGCFKLTQVFGDLRPLLAISLSRSKR